MRHALVLYFYVESTFGIYPEMEGVNGGTSFQAGFQRQWLSLPFNAQRRTKRGNAVTPFDFEGCRADSGSNGEWRMENANENANGPIPQTSNLLRNTSCCWVMLFAASASVCAHVRPCAAWLTDPPTDPPIFPQLGRATCEVLHGGLGLDRMTGLLRW